MAIFQKYLQHETFFKEDLYFYKVELGLTYITFVTPLGRVTVV